MEIKILNEENYQAYQQFVNSSNEALYGHSLEVKDLISKHFGFLPRYIIAIENGDVKGCLPLFEADSLIEGKRFVSLPFFPFGGVIGESEDVKKSLLDKAKEVSKTGKFLEIRQRGKLSKELEKGLVKQTPIIDFLLRFDETIEKTFNSLDKRVRYDIKKAQKNNLTVILGKNQKQLDDFYKVYLYTKKKRGVPAWPYKLFKDALEKCDTLVGVTYLEGKPIAAAFFFMHRDEIEYGFAGADYKYTSLCPYYILLWEVVKYGMERGYKVLDFGGTTKELNDGNLYKFKERWCKERQEIPYYFYATDSKNIPTLQKSFALYKIYGKCWSILPKWLINKISPWVIRQFV